MDEIILEGISGRHYLFEIYPKEGPFPASAGVFVILSRDSDGDHVLYVGQSENLQTMLDRHPKAIQFELYGATHVGVRLESKEHQRITIKTNLLCGYRPVCND